MKKITFLLSALIVFTVFSRCGKDEQPSPPNPLDAYSYWTVNNDTIAYRNIIVKTAPLLTELRVISSAPPEHMLSFAFQMGSLPHSGTYKVDYVASDPGMCNVYVIYNDTTYDVDQAHNITTVKISTLPNGKGRYELEPTWFYKHLVPSDSILVKGVIIEP